MKCGNVREELMEAVLGGPGLASPAIEEHLATCPACAEEVASLRRTMSLMDEWQTPEPSPYFRSRLAARVREERSHAGAGWLAWLRRPAVATAAAALLALGVGLLQGAHSRGNGATVAQQGAAGARLVTTSAVNDLQYLDNHADLFSDFDALDDGQKETD